MMLTVSTPRTRGELTARRTNFPADDDMAVQVFLTSAHTAVYLTVAEARTLAERLLAATAADVTAGVPA